MLRPWESIYKNRIYDAVSKFTINKSPVYTGGVHPRRVNPGSTERRWSATSNSLLAFHFFQVDRDVVEVVVGVLEDELAILVAQRAADFARHARDQ